MSVANSYQPTPLKAGSQMRQRWVMRFAGVTSEKCLVHGSCVLLTPALRPNLTTFAFRHSVVNLLPSVSTQGLAFARIQGSQKLVSDIFDINLPVELLDSSIQLPQFS
jgi:hypothetical protein